MFWELFGRSLNNVIVYCVLNDCMNLIIEFWYIIWWFKLGGFEILILNGLFCVNFLKLRMVSMLIE